MKHNTLTIRFQDLKNSQVLIWSDFITWTKGKAEHEYIKLHIPGYPIDARKCHALNVSVMHGGVQRVVLSTVLVIAQMKATGHFYKNPDRPVVRKD